MRQVETALSGHSGVNGSTAYALSRRDAITLALVVCLPVPALAVSGLSVPLPQIVQRVTASLVPFLAGDDSAQSDALSRASIRLTISESTFRASSRLPASNVIPGEGSSGRVTHRVVRPAVRPAASREDGRTSPRTPAPEKRATPAAATAAVPRVEQGPQAPARSAAAGAPTAAVSGTQSEPGGTGQPVVVKPPVVVGPIAVDPVVTSGPGTTSVSATVTAPVVGDVTVTATIPVAAPELPVAPVPDPAQPALTSQVDTVVKTVLGGR